MGFLDQAGATALGNTRSTRIVYSVRMDQYGLYCRWAWRLTLVLAQYTFAMVLAKLENENVIGLTMEGRARITD